MDTDLLEVVLWDRGSAVSLMEHLSRYRSFLVQPDGRRWIVFARCDHQLRNEVLKRVEAWAIDHDRPDLHVDEVASPLLRS